MGSPVHSASPRATAARDLLDRVTTDDVFQTLTREAAQRLGVPYTQISLVTDQVVAGAGQGPLERGQAVDLDQAVCTTVVRTEEPVVSEDLTTDPRLMSIDAVADGRVRSYAGVPIRLEPEGYVVGVFCAYDQSARSWTAEQIEVLEEFAARTVAALRSTT